ncbi:NAD(P)-dependent alcohol dehydrogenase [Paeniglutamicibacter sulfureus]|uniref:NAD(P)-dependent alcohol dehydrogenase n=1 Tax=Paeniglutamicibacter sulfureus TaxID=43666 RepID=UPI002665A0D8|nr:NAD(P)-dependent alcohol dehydrogenase [Paeniglutamicibacter sulfureus]MDO2934729.1 NAD(P)-dependent alcohol dehydrogenase [Paeniglutamicibacter sulfureus]
MKTRAAVAIAPETDLEIREIEVDDPRADELRVRMVASGVCHTDAIIRDQWYPVPLPVVLGHEGAGIVEAVGSDVQGFAEGDKVVIGPAFCGRCEQCLAGHPMYCVNFYDRNFGVQRPDGSKSFSDAQGPIGSHFFGQSSFAELTNVVAHGAVKVPDGVPLEILGPLGCGIMTGSGAVLNVLQPQPGSSIAVFGTGAVGMAGMLAAKAAGATTIIMVDIVPERLDFAKELGATHTVNSKETDPVEAIKEITGGGANFALDTTGVPPVFSQMTQSLATRGHGALVGAAKLGTEAPFAIGNLLLTGIKVSMVIEGDAVPKEFIPRLVSLHARGLFPFDKLIKKYPFEDINRAFADSADGSTLKPVIVF